MRLLLVTSLLVAPLAAAGTTTGELLVLAERLGDTRATGWTDPALTKQLRALEAKLGITLPIDPAAVRAGEPKPGNARWGNSSFSNQGPRRPHLIAGTLAAPGPLGVASVGGSLLVVKGSAQLGFVVDSLVIATGDVDIAFLTNSVVVSAGRVSVSHFDGSAALADRLDVSGFKQQASKMPCAIAASSGVRVGGLGVPCRAFNTPARFVERAAASFEDRVDPTLSVAKPIEAPPSPLVSAPRCRAVLAPGEKGSSVGVASVPWRAGRGGLPAALAGTQVVDVFDGVVALERAGGVGLVRATAAGDEAALRAPELLELGGDFEVHGVGFYQPGQLDPTHVKVVGGKRVVLVLSASEPTAWQVEVDAGTSLLAVVLFGAGGHRLTFTKGTAPVVLDVDGWPCGRTGLRWDPSSGSQEETAALERLKVLLGRPRALTFTSVQGGVKEATGSTGEASYVVGAPKK